MQAGDIVNYMPGTEYWLSTDSKGDLVFELFDKRNDKRYFGPTSPGGQEKWLPAQFLKPGKPIKAWKAKVMAVYPDGSLALEVKHPNGCLTVYHDRVKQDDALSAGSWHMRVEQEEGKREEDE